MPVTALQYWDRKAGTFLENSYGKSYTPYSMNRLFSKFLRKFGGAFLEVCETVSGGIWQVLRGKIKEKYPGKKQKK